MSKPSTPQDLFDQLMAINQAAFASGFLDVAYHSLAAALHCARNIESDQPLLLVEHAANEQLAWIDQNQPEYEHSTRSAAVRHHENIFTLLSRQAATVQQMRKFNRKHEQGRL